MYPVVVKILKNVSIEMKLDKYSIYLSIMQKYKRELKDI